MKLTDGKKTVEIIMNEWTGDKYTSDWSNDFFEASELPLIWVDAIDGKAHEVEDVDYCIEQAMDWANYLGDFCDPDVKEADAARGVKRCVDVEVL